MTLGVDDFFNQSGASLNRTRPQTAPLPHQHNSSFIDNIDLYNFEDPKYDGSKYVLTSPRSLEACSRMGIKPLDILYKPLQDFQDELVPQGVAMRTIYNIYDEHEANRHKTLKLCRQEREAIIREDEYQRGDSVHIRSPISRHSRHKSTPEVHQTPFRTRHYSDDYDTEIIHGSTQRKRTAWTTSIGHDRITEDEINIRAKELLEEGTKLHPSKSEGATTTQVRKKRKKHNDASRYSSLSDLGITGVGRSTSWARLPNSDVRPVTNSKLRSKLKSSKNTSIPSRDQKILEALMSKNEQEQYQNRIRRKSELELDKELKDIEKEKTQAEVQRRKNLVIQNKLREQKRMEKQSRIKRESDNLQEDSAHYAKAKEKQWTALSKKQEEIKQRKLQEKKEREKQRKMSQELALKAYEKEQEEFKALVNQKLEHDMKRASLRREAREYEDTMHRKSRNLHKQRLHHERKSIIEHIDRDDVEDLKTAIELKEARAHSNYQINTEEKEQTIKMNQREKERRLSKARESQQLMDEEIEAWHSDLLRHRQMSQEKATDIAKLTAAQKAHRAHEERIRKQSGQKRNFKRLLDEENAWKDGMKDTITYKDMKSKLLQQEKEQTIQESRTIAATTQKLRDELKKTYQGDSFDKKAKQVQMEARVGAGVYSATKNMSTLTIG